MPAWREVVEVHAQAAAEREEAREAAARCISACCPRGWVGVGELEPPPSPEISTLVQGRYREARVRAG